MTRRPSDLTQAEMERAIRAAKKHGLPRVRVGKITFELTDSPVDEPAPEATNSPDTLYEQWKQRAGAA